MPAVLSKHNDQRVPSYLDLVDYKNPRVMKFCQEHYHPMEDLIKKSDADKTIIIEKCEKLKRGEVTEEDVAELHNFVLEGVDLYANEPTEIHPLYWNHSSQRWDDHPQSVESEMARLHEESLRIEAGTAAVTPSVWNLWGLFGSAPSPHTQTQTQTATIQHQHSQNNVRINLRVHGGARPGAPAGNDAASNSVASSSSSSHHFSWKGAALGVGLSFVGSLLFGFIYRSMKNCEPKTTGMLKTSLRAAIFVMEKILPPVGFAVLVASVISASVMCPPLLIPLAIGFFAGLAGERCGEFVANIFFPMEDGKIEPQFDPALISALEEAKESEAMHMAPVGFFPAGLCQGCRERPASTAFLHAPIPVGAPRIAHMAYCDECYQQHIKNKPTPKCWCNTPALHFLPPGELKNTKSDPATPHDCNDGCLFVGECGTCPETRDTILLIRNATGYNRYKLNSCAKCTAHCAAGEKWILKGTGVKLETVPLDETS